MESICRVALRQPRSLFSHPEPAQHDDSTIDEVQQEASARVERVLTNYRLLNEIVHRHEAKIRRRWRKKNQLQRSKILLECWPHMPAKHQPDFDTWFRQNKRKATDMGAEEKDYFKWPYVNQEDLSSATSLLLLLNARGRNHPTDFAAADSDAMNLGKCSYIIVAVNLSGYTMMLNSARQDGSYGRLLSWEEHPGSEEMIRSGQQYSPGEGLLVLEAQDRLLEFLVQCCRKVLHDIPPADILSALHPVEEEPPPISSTGIDGTTHLAILAEEAPYRLPAGFDLSNIQSLLAAQVARAEDHVLSLREDPSYFAEHLHDASEHCDERIRDVHGLIHPFLTDPKHKDMMCARNASSVVYEAYNRMEVFYELEQFARELQSLQSKHADNIVPEKDLPDDLLTALLKFRRCLHEVVKGALAQLDETAPASPPLRDSFVRKDTVFPVLGHTLRTRPVKGGIGSRSKGPLLPLLQTLWENGPILEAVRLPLMINEIDRQVRMNPESGKQISPYVAMVIGEISILGECIRQVDAYFPWARSFRFKLGHQEDTTQTVQDGHICATREALLALMPLVLTPFAPLMDPSDNKFDYPTERSRNEQNVAKLRAAELALDSFWEAADDRLTIVRKEASGLGRLLARRRPPYRTPEWVEPPPKAKRTKLTTPDRDTPVNTFSAFELNEQPISARKEVSAATPKPKVKTRGTPGPAAAGSSSSTPEEASDEGPADPQPPLEVDARALSVFRILFFNPVFHTTPGEVPWKEFLHAMRAAGFSAQKLYGSVWHFRPETIDLDRSIQFHEPHPIGKLSFRVARRYGRRLHRAYGWDGGMFAMEHKA
ncbi:uncharacterized protein E0L32_002869 [Thyridium curvatum]|uniref:Uncharacterized protein n=1 Tax=Thyridium curvatum TaxID=1093900 RepID=A0A507BM09_9PEZI|nr:uncharacterized protein E0L32_002869 [Thyridium curvatum]TPX17768.1 hypothetical protein E0L32_002869 [Thyridium curvatum]